MFFLNVGDFSCFSKGAWNSRATSLQEIDCIQWFWTAENCLSGIGTSYSDAVMDVDLVYSMQLCMGKHAYVLYLQLCTFGLVFL